MQMNLKACRILVTPTSYGKNDPQLRSELESSVGEVVYNKFGRPLTSAEVADSLGRKAMAISESLESSQVLTLGFGTDAPPPGQPEEKPARRLRLLFQRLARMLHVAFGR